ncbi:hypothetical protein ACHAWF_017583 [Thalassiosira exigua]
MRTRTRAPFLLPSLGLLASSGGGLRAATGGRGPPRGRGGDGAGAAFAPPRSSSVPPTAAPARVRGRRLRLYVDDGAGGPSSRPRPRPPEDEEAGAGGGPLDGGSGGGDDGVPRSAWYRRWREYSSPDGVLYDDDFALTDAELIESDPTLNLLSSEVGVREYLSASGLTASETAGVPLSVLAERTFDTIEDAWEHVRRAPYENGWAEITPEEEATRNTVVVLGR